MKFFFKRTDNFKRFKSVGFSYKILFLSTNLADCYFVIFVVEIYLLGVGR